MAAKQRTKKGGSKAAALAAAAAAAAAPVATMSTPDSASVSSKSWVLARAALGSITDPADLLEVVHWTRQLMGVVMGAVFGAAGITGIGALTAFLCASVLGPNTVVAGTMLGEGKVDEAELEKIGKYKTEGLFSASALFVLTWIVVYTTCLPGSA
jgi:hypothetical protein